ncbi:hypothetical protein UFOVP402_29 [uncultured Caudovirales phage]|uniref:Holin n=1 Tax=uncultured Caudovirales phage TaxID=2100421 RepID=A0A6J5M5Q1_9CAUD|nr:hypothetical protein UFOVP402_29 [uncultured Caudovirales phage]
MNEEIYLIALGLAGTAVHYLKEWAKANKAGKEYELKRSIPTIILSVITTTLLIHLRADIEPLYVVTPFAAVILGYIGNSIFFSFVDAKKPKIED